MNDDQALYQVTPRLIARNNGDWMAVTPRGWPLALGVCAHDEESAKEKFSAALLRWAAIDTSRLTDQACGTGAASHLRQ